MAIRGRITYVAPADVLRKELNAELKKAMQANIELWHEIMLPGHFNRQAHAKYGYTKRKTKYIRYKLRKTGQANDLVFSGRLQQQVKRKIRISGTKNKMNGIMDVPKYFYYRQRGGSAVDKTAEVTAITQDEALALAQNLNELVSSALAANRTLRTKTL